MHRYGEREFPVKGKLQSGCADLPYTCDVCHRPRSLKVHTRCSKIRQERHAQQLRDEAFDNLLMDDKKQ